MRILLLILAMSTACSEQFQLPGSKPLETLDAEGKCTKRISHRAYDEKSAMLSQQLLAIKELKISKGGGFCSPSIAYEAELIGGKWQVARDKYFDGDEARYVMTERESEEFDALIKGLRISNVHPDGCRVVSDGCSDSINFEIGAVSYHYSPDNLSSYSGIDSAWLTSSSYLALLDFAEKRAPPGKDSE